jgi:hypothetical protein
MRHRRWETQRVLGWVYLIPDGAPNDWACGIFGGHKNVWVGQGREWGHILINVLSKNKKMDYTIWGRWLVWTDGRQKATLLLFLLYSSIQNHKNRDRHALFKFPEEWKRGGQFWRLSLTTYHYNNTMVTTMALGTHWGYITCHTHIERMEKVLLPSFPKLVNWGSGKLSHLP